MDQYIEGNKAAWEEAFENRDASWGADIAERIRREDYPFFNEETKSVLKQLPTEGAVIGQFCCNNGRELLSLVKCGRAKRGVGFDIAENQVAFANEKARELDLPCAFEAVNIYDIDDRYREQFDVVLITIGALCWFDDLNRFFAVAAKCMKPGACIVINEQHPCTIVDLDRAVGKLRRAVGRKAHEVHAAIGIVITQRGILRQDVIERLVAAAIAQAFKDLPLGHRRINHAAHEGAQRRDHLARVGCGQKTAAKERDDDRKQAGNPADKPSLIAAPGTQGDDNQQNNVDDQCHM